MSRGAAYGKGIYMADMLSVSLGYAASNGMEHWPRGKTSGVAVIVAVCEVVDRQGAATIECVDSCIREPFTLHPGQIRHPRGPL